MLETFLDKFDVALVLICTNFALSAVSSILDKVKDKTATDVDDKASGWLHQYLPTLQKLIDWVSGNRQH